ncbi:MAG: glycosyltransferase family 4 protein [Tildeniella torsiva UHER 1998/13D]|jgi:glycosyltransferase involved in cell wall biosynthesis|nr:glycosyltransferase family 4 protein [Tildeniella torsiva UHER 1998/13D]
MSQTATTLKKVEPFNTLASLRILFVSHTYVVGVNQGKLDAIAQAGAEVGLLVPQHWQAPQWNKRFEAENPYPRIALYPCPIYFEGRAGAHFYPPLAILKTIRDFKPDIIQVEEEVFSLAALEVAFWARRCHIPVVLFGWENRDRQLPAPRRWMRQYVFDSTQTILAGNHEGADLLKQWGYAKPVEVMPQMGVDTELFSPQLRPPKPSDAPLCIGFVGRIAYQKGIDTLIEAARLLQQLGLRFQISLCGSGSDEAQFKQLAHDYNLDDVVVWTGGVRHDEVPQAMAKMDVLVLPSRTVPTWKEQFGHVLIEAMALGLPVVGSTCGEIPNVVGEPELVFAEGDAPALASILARLITDLPWRQAMATHSLKQVDEHYSHQRIAERLIELWQSIVQAG